MYELLAGKKILVTGGTGSLGKELVKELLKFHPSVVRVLDLDETKQFEMHHELEFENPKAIEQDKVRFFVGDIRDKERLVKAMEDVHIVFHLAALKHVQSCEYNAFEAVKTNVLGTQNVIDAALAQSSVERVIYTSSDKAAYPSNTMGATKLLAERLITSANYHKGARKTIFSSVRFGNVLGSRGSVLPLFNLQIEKGGPVTITHEDMTRFVLPPKRAIYLIFRCAEVARGGEIFILKMPVVKITDLATILIDQHASKRGVQLNIPLKIVGLKEGEKLYEDLMTEEESTRALENDELLLLLPQHIKLFQTVKSDTYHGFLPVQRTTYSSRYEKILGLPDLRNLLVGEGLI